MGLKEVIFEIIENIQQGKENSNIEPKNALMREIESICYKIVQIMPLASGKFLVEII